MDTVTQAIFGAVVAQAGFRRQLGRRALAWGAFAGTLPDFDSVAAAFGTIANLQVHRGVTHSVFFAPVAAPLLGWATARYYRWRSRRRADLGDLATRGAQTWWSWLYFAALITHPLIDLFTQYGTQLLAPFSNHRFAVSAMPIIDPVYTLILVVALAVGILARSRPRLAVRSAAAALTLIWAYTLMAWAVGERVADTAAAALRRDGHPAPVVAAYPTLLQPLWRRVVARTAQGDVLVGFATPATADSIAWRHFGPEADPLTARLAATRLGEVFAWFADGQVLWRVERVGGRTEVAGYDLRYGMPPSETPGMWGVRAALQDGALADPHFFQNRPEVGLAFSEMRAAIFGG